MRGVLFCMALVGLVACGFPAPAPATSDGSTDDAIDAATDGGGDGSLDPDGPEVDAPAGTPGAPTGVMAKPGDATITVSWLAPADPGSSPITSYRVEATGDGVTAGACMVSGALDCTLTNLVNGATYGVRVIATNAAGDGPPSSSVRAMPLPAALMDNVAVWLDAHDLAAGSVMLWTSRDSMHRDPSQALPAARPARDELALLPAVTFDGTDDAMRTPGFMQGSARYTILVVSANRETIPIASTVSPVYSNSQCGSGNPGFAMYSYNSFFGNANERRPSVESGNAQGNSVSINGSNETTVPNGQNATPDVVIPGDTWFLSSQHIRLAASGIGDNALTLGSYVPGGCHHGAISIGELIVFGRDVPDAELDTVERYLAQKWQITLP